MLKKGLKFDHVTLRHVPIDDIIAGVEGKEFQIAGIFATSNHLHQILLASLESYTNLTKQVLVTLSDLLL